MFLEILGYLEILPFKGIKNNPAFIVCSPDIVKPDTLKPFNVNVSDKLNFIDRLLPPRPAFEENIKYSKSYFVNLHLAVKAYETHNYLGARIPLEHNNINVQVFRSYLSRFDYPYIHRKDTSFTVEVKTGELILFHVRL